MTKTTKAASLPAAIASLTADECLALGGMIEGAKLAKSYKSDAAARQALAGEMARKGLTVRTIDGTARIVAHMAEDRAALEGRYAELVKLASRKGGIARSQVYAVTGWGKRNVLATMQALAHKAKRKCKVERINGEVHYAFA